MMSSNWNWERDGFDLVLKVEEGTYHIGGADSMGQHEIRFHSRGKKYYVGTEFGEDNAKRRVEQHYRLVRAIPKRIKDA